MALLQAFFDESGLHDEPIVTGVAAFLGPVSAWIDLEEKWSALLAHFHDVTGRPLKAFHASDCENGAAEWRGVSREIREAFYRRFAQIICDENDLQGVAISVVLDDWNRLATPELRSRLGSPYQLCAEHCFQQIGNWSRRGLDGTPVELVFAEHQSLSPRAADIFEHYMQAKPWAHFRSLTFGSPVEYLPLQCADMLSYESYTYWLKIEKDGLGFGLERPVMSMLRDAMRIENSACYSGMGLRNAITRYHVSIGLPDPFR